MGELSTSYISFGDVKAGVPLAIKLWCERLELITFLIMRSMNKYNRHVGVIAYLQLGRGMRPFPIQSQIPQRGRGIGSFVRRTGRRFVPMAKDMGREVLKAGLPEAGGLVHDVVGGVPVKRALKSRAKRLGKRTMDIGKANLGKAIKIAMQSGSGRGKGSKRLKRKSGKTAGLKRPPPFVGTWDKNVFM